MGCSPKIFNLIAKRDHGAFLLTIFEEKLAFVLFSTIRDRSFGDILLNNRANNWWSFGVRQNALDRLGGEATQFVLIFYYIPCGASPEAKRFGLLV